jgi:hypothetical protein
MMGPRGAIRRGGLDVRNDEPPAEPARLDAFISYRRLPGAGLAFVQRNDARNEARLAQSHALAAEAISDLAENPGQSLRTL